MGFSLSKMFSSKFPSLVSLFTYYFCLNVCTRMILYLAMSSLLHALIVRSFGRQRQPVRCNVVFVPLGGDASCSKKAVVFKPRSDPMINVHYS